VKLNLGESYMKNLVLNLLDRLSGKSQNILFLRSALDDLGIGWIPTEDLRHLRNSELKEYT
jgi:hypothetical protein